MRLTPRKSPFVTMFSLAGIAIAAHVVNAVVLTSATSSANSGIFSTSRMVYGLAQEGDAPKSLGVLSAQGVPRNALFLTSTLLLSSIVLLYCGRLHYWGVHAGDHYGGCARDLRMVHDPH